MSKSREHDASPHVFVLMKIRTLASKFAHHVAEFLAQDSDHVRRDAAVVTVAIGYCLQRLVRRSSSPSRFAVSGRIRELQLALTRDNVLEPEIPRTVVERGRLTGCKPSPGRRGSRGHRHWCRQRFRRRRHIGARRRRSEST